MSGPDARGTDAGDMALAHRGMHGALATAPSYVVGNVDPHRARLIANFYENVVEVLRVHHLGEDELVYPLLWARCVQERDMLERVSAQHHLLDEPMRAANEAIAIYASAPSALNQASLVSAIGALDGAVVPHFADEELYVVPLISEHLTPEEWAQARTHGSSQFRKDKIWITSCFLRENLRNGELEESFAHLPQVIRERWQTEWSPAYDEFMQQVRAD